MANGTGVPRKSPCFLPSIFHFRSIFFVERQRLCIAAFQLSGVITLPLVLMITEGHMSLEGNAQPVNYMCYLLTDLLLSLHFAVQVHL